MKVIKILRAKINIALGTSQNVQAIMMELFYLHN